MIPEVTRELVLLYTMFFRIGLFSIGGGYVMLPMLRVEVTEKRDWLSVPELLDYYAISQATPGIISVNIATHVGFKRRGVAGALAATAGVVMPSVIVILLIAIFLPALRANVVVARAFAGIRVAVAVLLTGMLGSLVRKGWKSAVDVVLTVAAFGLVVFGDVSPIPLIIGAGLVGYLLGRWRRHRA